MKTQHSVLNFLISTSWVETARAQIWLEDDSFYFILFLNLKHCISFAKHQNESATGIHAFKITGCLSLSFDNKSV